MFSGLRMWIGAIVGAAFGGLLLFAKMWKKQRDEARRERDLLDAGRMAARHIKKISKDQEEKMISRTAKLVREINKEKDDEFKGVDNLNNPNDY